MKTKGYTLTRGARKAHKAHSRRHAKNPTTTLPFEALTPVQASERIANRKARLKRTEAKMKQWKTKQEKG
jgi:hypothetical protein